MLVDRFTCPSCGVLLKPGQPVPVGKDVKCFQCGARFTVPAAPAPPPPPPVFAVPAPARPKTRPPKPPPLAFNQAPEEPRLARDLDSESQADFFEPAPRRRPRAKRKRGGGKGLLIGLLIGFGVLLFAVCGLGGAGWYSGWFGTITLSNPLAINPRVTMDNYERTDLGMTLPEVEAILGTGRTIRAESMPKWSGPQASYLELTAQYSLSQWYDWQNGKMHIFVGFGPSQSGRQVAGVVVHYTEAGPGINNAKADIRKSMTPTAFE